MSMYTLLRNQPEPTIEEIEDAFQGTGLEAQPKGSNSSWGSRRLGKGQSVSQEWVGIWGTAFWRKGSGTQRGGYGLLGA